MGFTAGTETLLVDQVPVLCAAPPSRARNGRLAVWLPHLGGSKDICWSVLERFARLGFAAVSLDPRGHGDRAVEPAQALMEGAFSRFRQVMWPLLGGTVLDALAVIDWAVRTLELNEDVVAGGVSMGGDVAVALGGIDPRIRRVAGIVATPDWTRPGMTRIGEPDRVIDQGRPGRLGSWLYEHLDPMTHLDRYRKGPEIRFDLGESDTHVPAEAAVRFRRTLEAAGATGRVHIRVHHGDHLDVARDAAVVDDAADWLAGETSA